MNNTIYIDIKTTAPYHHREKITSQHFHLCYPPVMVLNAGKKEERKQMKPLNHKKPEHSNRVRQVKIENGREVMVKPQHITYYMFCKTLPP